MRLRLLFIVLLAFFFCELAKPQEQKTRRDSIKVERDSLKIERDSLNKETDSLNIVRDSANYKALEVYSQKSKITSFIHKLIFKSVDNKAVPPTKKNRIKKPKPYKKAEGKIIRDINITTLDPFGYSLQDTSIHPKVFWMKATNNLHIKTQPVIIKNLLLFKKDELYDSLLVNESIRLIRSQKYIRDLVFYSLPTSRKGDSVDVYIRVSDVWSLVPAFSMSNSAARIGLSDINFAGLGSRFQGEILRNRTEDYNITRIGYFVPNIRRTYISLNIQNLFSGNHDMIKNYEFSRAYYSVMNSNLLYLFSDNRDLIRGIDLERTFYSPVAKWAGGIFLGQMIMAQSYLNQDTIRYLASLANVQDYWGARSWQLFRWKPADGRITSLVLSGRMIRMSYHDRPQEAITANVFNKEVTYFAGIGITSRKYIQDTYIFNYGKIEDFPVGRSFDITLGMDVQKTNRWYLGLKASWGDYYQFGYLSTHLEYGTYKGITGYQQGVVTYRVNYFTRLLNLGSWKIRQFIRPTLIIGINRLPTDNLTFREGMKGFENLEVSANKMMVLNLQTQSYPRWNLFGFHFGPFLFTSLGMLGNQKTGFKNSHLYSSFGLGILIKNNYLTFNTFQISISFYPYVPGQGYNVLRTNAYKTNDYGFRDFEISKPMVVDYR
jgi:hypothetical protein